MSSAHQSSVTRAVCGNLLAGALGWLLLGGHASFAAEKQPMDHSGPNANHLEIATFAGGCFWCMQPPFDKLDGVRSTTVGYTGGTEPGPTYEQVSSGTTGHAESIEVTYDPSNISYEQLLDVFWRNIDPTTLNREFADVGRQYRTAIFSHSDKQHRLAEASKQALERSGHFGKPIVTEIVPASTFYPAEEYHQQYYKKNPLRYQLYRVGSGRDGYLRSVWGRASH